MSAAERLRETVADHMGRKWCGTCESFDHECGCTPTRRSREVGYLLQDIVDELGITEEMVDTNDAELFEGFHHGDMIAEVRRLAFPLRTLLEASGER